MQSSGTSLPPNVRVFEGAKDNLPDENALAAAQFIKDYVSRLTDNDVLFLLISGGGSALLPMPCPGVTLAEKVDVIRRLVRAGASINDLNTVRIALSSVKGGQLAVAAQNAHRVISLIISDVIGDPIDLIASGPTAVQQLTQNTRRNAKHILEHYRLWSDVPRAIQAVLQEDTIVPTVIPTNGETIIIANSSIAIAECLKEAHSLNLTPIYLSDAVSGSVHEVSEAYFQLARGLKHYNQTDHDAADHIRRLSQALKVLNVDEKRFTDDLEKVTGSASTLCLIAGGETTVTLQPGHGLGGRNQQMAAEFMHKCAAAGLEDVYLLSAGTDGIDGPTSAAGAIGSLNILRDQFSAQEHKDLEEKIRRNDCFRLFEGKDCHIVIGHTGTNVMDLQILLVVRRDTETGN